MKFGYWQDLELPYRQSLAAAQPRAHTSHGSVTSDFDLTVRSGTLGKDHVEGQIGGGGPLVQLSTSNGSIRILRL